MKKKASIYKVRFYLLASALFSLQLTKYVP